MKSGLTGYHEEGRMLNDNRPSLDKRLDFIVWNDTLLNCLLFSASLLP